MYGDGKVTKVLQQRTSGPAEILSAILRFRAKYAPDPSTPRLAARLAAPKQFDALVRVVEWKLVQMPLPRLQLMGNAPDECIYRIGWTHAVRKQDGDRYQQGDADAFDCRITLKLTTASRTSSLLT